MTVSSLNQGLLKVGVLGPSVSTVAPQNLTTVSPLGEVRVENPASNLFLDTFDNPTALDTINKWTSSTGGTGSSVVVSAGQVVLTGGTVANSFAKMTSQVAAKTLNGNIGIFRQSDPGFLLVRMNANVQAPIPANNLIQWGAGNSPTTPTIASSMTDFYGWEITTSGKLQAVTYASGSRLLIQDLSISPPTNTPPGTPAVQPADASAHKYFIYFRGDICYWCVDDKDNVVAQFQTGASGPNVNALPLVAQVISNGGSAATFQLNAVSVGDTSHTAGVQFLFNGLTYEPQSSNQDANSAIITLTAQGAGTVNSSDIVNTNGRGINLGINTTVDSSGAYTVTIQGKDIASGTYYNILTSASIAATGFTLLSVYPGLTAASNTVANAILPRTWRVQVVVTTGPITATIGASVIN
jgi:hypothetical protein